ncbi:MAG: anthranilate phosphoribosyltransferase [Firmicutes bacterium HGW-Firmicutes-15]|nr:MAG: anthranilate phosphoribosyltransferase [Firmicutes bacterium HGW-Firmicutes-15]
MFVNYLKRVIDGEQLSSSETYEVINLLLTEDISENQVAAFFAALRMRRETGEELFGFASALLEKAIKHEGMEDLLDTCGTGGGGQKTFNISTAAAIVCAACGVRVAKHGNRAVTSQTGSADVLEALGVRVDLDIIEARQALEEVGIAFLFAPNYHPVMKKFGPMRRSLGISTAFNFLGPLINPFCPAYQILGVSDPAMMLPVATALFKLGRKRALVVHALNGMDEISHVGITMMARVDEDGVHSEELDPTDLGFTATKLIGIGGGAAVENAQLIKEIMAGKAGPAREVVILNAAAALMLAGKAIDMPSGVAMATDAIDSGRAASKLRDMALFARKSRIEQC